MTFEADKLEVEYRFHQVGRSILSHFAVCLKLFAVLLYKPPECLKAVSKTARDLVPPPPTKLYVMMSLHSQYSVR